MLRRWINSCHCVVSVSTCAQEKSEKTKEVARRPNVQRTAMSESENDIVFEVLDADPLQPGRLTPLHDDELSDEGPPPQQEEGPEIQQSQEEDANATSAKVIGACQPPDDDLRLWTIWYSCRSNR